MQGFFGLEPFTIGCVAHTSQVAHRHCGGTLQVKRLIAQSSAEMSAGLSPLQGTDVESSPDPRRSGNLGSSRGELQPGNSSPGLEVTLH